MDRHYQSLLERIQAEGIHSLSQQDLDRYYRSCSTCGCEYDSEGWCPNYCSTPEFRQPVEDIRTMRNFYHCRHIPSQNVPGLETYAWLTSVQIHAGSDEEMVEAFHDYTAHGGGMVPIQVRLGDLEILEEE